MVMHPHLENLSSDTHTFTEPLNLIIHLFSLQLPPQLFREPQHLLLLLSTELRPEPLLAAATPLSHLRYSSHVSAPGVLHHVPTPSSHGLQPSFHRGARDLAVEVAMAAAGCALEGGGRDAVHVQGELPTAVGSVATEAGCMVAEALSVEIV